MTGPEHYVRGGELLALAESIPSNDDETNPAATLLTAQAQAHFTAALAAATALGRAGADATMPRNDHQAWFASASENCKPRAEVAA